MRVLKAVLSLLPVLSGATFPQARETSEPGESAGRGPAAALSASSTRSLGDEGGSCLLVRVRVPGPPGLPAPPVRQ